MAALRELMFERGYDAVSVSEIIARANVGRSTFYEHFANKEDVLSESLSPVLTPLADAVTAGCSPARVAMVLRHFREVRPMVATMLVRGSVRVLMLRLLAELIVERLRAGVAVETMRGLPVALVAQAVATGQLGLIEAWLSCENACEADAVAHALHASSRAAATAMVLPTPGTR